MPPQARRIYIAAVNTQLIMKIVRFETQRLLRSPAGAVFLAFYFILFTWLMMQLHAIGEKLSDKVGTALDATGDQGRKVVSDAIGWVVEVEGSQILELVSEHPPLLLLFFALVLGFTPVAALLASVDQTASDIGSRHLRFVLLRVDRKTLYVGKTIAAWVFYSAALAIVCVMALGVTLSVGGDVGEAFLYTVRIWLTGVLYALPFVCFAGFASALTGHAALAALMVILYTFIVWAISSVGAWMSDGAGMIGLLMPTHWKYSLLADDMTVVLKPVVHSIVFGVLVFALGMRTFRRRDI